MNIVMNILMNIPDPMVSLRLQRGICHLTPWSFCFQAKHTQEGSQTWGVNGETGALVDMKELGICEPLAVKLQTYKTAVEVSRGGETSEPLWVSFGRGGHPSLYAGVFGWASHTQCRACRCLSLLLEVG